MKLFATLSTAALVALVNSASLDRDDAASLQSSENVDLVSIHSDLVQAAAVKKWDDKKARKKALKKESKKQAVKDLIKNDREQSKNNSGVSEETFQALVDQVQSFMAKVDGLEARQNELFVSLDTFRADVYDQLKKNDDADNNDNEVEEKPDNGNSSETGDDTGLIDAEYEQKNIEWQNKINTAVADLAAAEKELANSSTNLKAKETELFVVKQNLSTSEADFQASINTLSTAKTTYDVAIWCFPVFGQRT